VNIEVRIFSHEYLSNGNIKLNDCDHESVELQVVKRLIMASKYKDNYPYYEFENNL
jgi:hypothetical protein